MTFFFKKGNTYNIAADDAVDIRKELPPGNYVVQFDERSEEFYLEHIVSFSLPAKLYGDVEKNTKRIINTYRERAVSTGLLLTGDKGTGKTMLAKNLAVVLANYGIPTIVINECWHGDAFNKFIQSIEQPCVVMFDEFEKIYTREKQEHILTLLDGVYPTKKLFIFTSNSTYGINEHMTNRPGRIFYSIQYTGLEDTFIREYCEDNLDNKSHIEQICKISALFASFNFDLLKALVEEMNRYDESPQDSLKILNAIPEDTGHNKYKLVLTLANGTKISSADLDDDGDWSGNPLAPRGVNADYRFYSNPDDDNWSWVRVHMSPTDLQTVDAIHGVFEYRDAEGNSIQLTKVKTVMFNFNAL